MGIVNLNVSLNQALIAFIHFTQKGNLMNKDQVKGAVKNIAGKVQEEAGKMIGSKEQQAKGLGKQITGTAQEKYGDAKAAVKNADKHH